jgi:hypothetical protein
LCFVGTRLPWVSEAVAGIALVDELGLFSVLQAQGPVAADERRELAALLDRHSAR